MQTEELTFTKGLDAFVAEWKDKPGSLLMILHRVQEEFGYVPRKIVVELSDKIGVPLAKIYGVLTFYHYFKLKKPGRNRIQVCLGTACYLKGAEDIIQEIEDIIGVAVNTTSEDGNYSLEAVRCVGCCGLSPVMVINGETYGKVAKDQLPEILAKYRNN